MGSPPRLNEAALTEALAIADAEQFIGSLPHGLDTVIGDRGLTLSHGERQRIALARAMLRHPRLLVLDEATNNLDSASETRVLDALRGACGPEPPSSSSRTASRRCAGPI